MWGAKVSNILLKGKTLSLLELIYRVELAAMLSHKICEFVLVKVESNTGKI